MALILIYTTIDSEAKAQNLANTLLDKKLIACAHIYSIQSVYNWENKVHQEPEWRIDMKTLARLKDKLEAQIKELHSYELPAIISHPIIANAGFRKWVDEMTRD